MRIGVISDTHLGETAAGLPPVVRDGLRGVDLIVHCGDVCAPEVLQELAQEAPVLAVAGNTDPSAILDTWGSEQLLDMEGWRIGVTHGHLGEGSNASERSVSVFTGRRVDAVLFGHSHHPVLERRHGMLMFNPGSPTRRRFEPRFSYGLLELTRRTLRATLIFFGP